jgi:hypothetical protein
MVKFKNIIDKITAYETFECVSDIQLFENIKMDLSLPISEIYFNIEDTKIALQVLALKALSGFNDPINDYNFYINDIEIDKNDLLLFDDNLYIFIEPFIERYKNILKDKNRIKIEFINPDNFEYVRHIKIVIDE